MTTPVHNLAALEHELEELKKQLPRHSLSPAILARLDELEEQIAELRQAAGTPTAIAPAVPGGADR